MNGKVKNIALKIEAAISVSIIIIINVVKAEIATTMMNCRFWPIRSISRMQTIAIGMPNKLPNIMSVKILITP